MAEHVRIIRAIESGGKLDRNRAVCIHNAPVTITQLGRTGARGGRLRHKADLRAFENDGPFEHDVRWSARKH